MEVHKLTKKDFIIKTGISDIETWNKTKESIEKAFPKLHFLFINFSAGAEIK